MHSRSATDTIAGYFYQFDHSILTILSLPHDSDSVTVEGIEDIDIHTATEVTAVQCKYYAGTEYNHSVIKPAVMLMLTHFKEVKEAKRKACRYKIWGHYRGGQQKLPQIVGVDFLKEHFLTFTEEKVKHYHHQELALDDADLGDFLGLLDFNVNGSSLEPVINFCRIERRA
jgi:hypothetical protein